MIITGYDDDDDYKSEAEDDFDPSSVYGERRMDTG